MSLHAIDVQADDAGRDGRPHGQEPLDELCGVGPVGIGLAHLMAQVGQHVGSLTGRLDTGRRDRQPQCVRRGDPDAQLAGRRPDLGGERPGRRRRDVPGTWVVTGEHVQRGGGVGDRPGEHARGGCGGHLLDPVGDTVATRLQADQSVAGRRDADRAAAVGRMGDRGHARCDRCTRTAGGATRRECGIPRVPCRAEPLGLGHRDRPELGGRGLAHQHEPSGTQTSHGQGVHLGRRVGYRVGPHGGRPTPDVLQVLDRDGHPDERRKILDRGVRDQFAGGAGVGPGTVVVTQCEGIERRIERVHLGQVVVEHLERADLLGPDGSSDVEGGIESGHGRRRYRRRSPSCRPTLGTGTHTTCATDGVRD